MACTVTVVNGILPQEEIELYVQRAIEKYGREPLSMQISLDGDYLDVKYNFTGRPFQRIRRITGYLVGTLDRFNNAKRAEEQDRVKHSL